MTYVTKGGERRGALVGLVQHSKCQSSKGSDTVKSVMIPCASDAGRETVARTWHDAMLAMTACVPFSICVTAVQGDCAATCIRSAESCQLASLRGPVKCTIDIRSMSLHALSRPTPCGQINTLLARIGVSTRGEILLA